MIKAKETLHEQMMLHVSRLMLEMKKDIAARLSEGKVVNMHTLVHDGTNFAAYVSGRNVNIKNKNTGKTHRVEPPPNPSMLGGNPAANDEHPNADKGLGHSMAMSWFLKKAEQIKANVPPEKQIEITDGHAKRLLDAAVKTHEISEGTVVGFPKIAKTHNTKKHIIHAMDSGEIMVHNKETGKTYKTDAVNGDTFLRTLGTDQVTDEHIEKLKKMTQHTVKSMN